MSKSHEQEKTDIVYSPPSPSIENGDIKFETEAHAGDDSFEIFKKEEGAVDFRTVSWIGASIIFLKITFATGVLTIPSAMYSLGAVPGALVVLGFGAVNTHAGWIQGNFRNRHPGCHSIADMAQVIGGPILKEVVGVFFVITWVICASSGIVGGSTALNALSLHGMCTNWFSFFVTLFVMIVASIRKFEHIGWTTWAAFVSIFTAVMIVVIGVSLRDRPAAAPQTGDFDLGFFVIGSPTFVTGITATANIFCASAGSSAFLPVISEMRNPNHYNRALYVCMSIVTASYFAFSLIVYRYCGMWVTSPSLGSAGPTLKRVAYGIGLFGLLITAVLYVHVSAKYLFVRILRHSKHLQSNSLIHWGTWLSCTIGLSAASFIIASAIPIFNYILALAASLGFAPIALALPAWLWLYDYAEFRHGSLKYKCIYYAHWLLAAVGVFIAIGGTYGTIRAISDAYASGQIGSAFSCADNSGSV